MPVTDITPWFEFGFPSAVLVLVLVAIGTGLWLFLKSYLKQQEKEAEGRQKQREIEFEARQIERVEREKIISEQQGFIRDLATTALADMHSAIKTQETTARALEKICKTLDELTKQVAKHEDEEERKLDVLQDGHTKLMEEMRELERVALVNHQNYAGGD